MVYAIGIVPNTFTKAIISVFLAIILGTVAVAKSGNSTIDLILNVGVVLYILLTIIHFLKGVMKGEFN